MKRRIHVEATGPEHADPVVLVHSSGMTSQQWARLRVRLDGQYRVLAPDLSGYGKSEGVETDEFSFYEDVDAISDIIERAGAPVHLVGHSYGGLLAAHAARRDPARIRTLTLFEPVAIGVLYSRTGEERAIAELEDIADSGAFFDADVGGKEAWMRRFIEFWSGRGAYDALPAGRRAALLACGRKSFLEVRSLMHDRTPHGAFAVIDAPTLLLTGTASPISAQRVSAIFAETLPRASLVVLEGLGHMAPIYAADRVNDLIARHIGVAPAASSPSA